MRTDRERLNDVEERLESIRLQINAVAISPVWAVQGVFEHLVDTGQLSREAARGAWRTFGIRMAECYALANDLWPTVSGALNMASRPFDQPDRQSWSSPVKAQKPREPRPLLRAKQSTPDD